MSGIQRWVRVGTADGDPPQRTRLVVLLNILILAEALSSLVWVPKGLEGGDRWVLSFSLGMCALAAIARLLNARRQLYVATVVLGTGTLLLMLPQVFLWGPASGTQYYLLLGVAAPFLLFAREHETTARILAACYAVSFVVVTLYSDRIEPAIEMPIEPRAMLTVNMAILVALFAAATYYARRTTMDAEHDAEIERDKSERLLLNVLPASVAARLKAGEQTIADSHAEVTVVFADLVGFTPLAATMSAERLVALLNDVFARFDERVERRGAEKIKTIGDAYMAAVGVPDPRPDHAAVGVALARDMLSAVDDVNDAHGLDLQLRVGLHSGRVVAGVIGRSKFSYDLWGDVVNVASRMESHGVPGRIQISGATRDLLGDDCAAEPRDAIEIKGRGTMQTFLL